MLLLLHMLLGMLLGIQIMGAYVASVAYVLANLCWFSYLLNYCSFFLVDEVVCRVLREGSTSLRFILQTCHEQVNSYKNGFYRGFKTRGEVEDDYSMFVLKYKSNHEVGKGVGKLGCNGLTNLIIFGQFVVIVILLLTCDRMWHVMMAMLRVVNGKLTTSGVQGNPIKLNGATKHKGSPQPGRKSWNAGNQTLDPKSWSAPPNSKCRLLSSFPPLRYR